MKSVMLPQKSLAYNAPANPPRSIYDRSHAYKTTLQPNLLVPFLVDEVIPGDSFRLGSILYLRFNDLLRPFMDNLFMDTFYFFVPYRLVWKNWEKLCGQQDYPDETTDYLTPKMTIPGFARMPGSIFDYMGIPQIGQDLAAGVPDANGNVVKYDYYIDDIPNSSLPYFTPSQLESPYDQYNYKCFPNFVFTYKTINGIGEVTEHEIKYSDNGGTFAKPNSKWMRLATLPCTVNSLNLRAYLLIFRDWFKDQNLWNIYNGPNNMVQLDGPDDYMWFRHFPETIANDTGATAFDFEPAYRMKRHDYFTSCLPWPQKGPEVHIPVSATSGSVPVVGTGKAMRLTTISADNPNNGMNFYAMSQPGNMALVHPWGSHPKNVGVDSRTEGLTEDLGDNLRYKLLGFGRGSGATDPYLETLGGVYSSIGGTINQLYEAMAIQQLYLIDGRGGTRYAEVLLAHFGVTNGDLALNRPLYLGGSSKRLDVMQIPQTSAAVQGSPQGNLAAISTTCAGSGFSQAFGEFGVVLGFVSIRADLTYQNGLDRMWSRSGRFDYYWPSLARLGEQSVLKKEVSWSQDESYREEVFGYQERWSEYRYKISRVTGFLNSNAHGSLDMWHLSQNLTHASLSPSFIREDVPLERVCAIKPRFYENPPFILDVWNDYKCARPLPTKNIPGCPKYF